MLGAPLGSQGDPKEGSNRVWGWILSGFGSPWRTFGERFFTKKLIFLLVLFWVSFGDHFFIDFSSILGRFWDACFEGFFTRLANSETSILAAIYNT